MSRERFAVHIFQMERCSFLLDIIRSRVVATLETEAHSGSILDCATILRVSPTYCDFVLKMKEKYPKHDIEQLCMEIYDCIWMHDNKETARFQEFDDSLLKEWYKVRAREKQLRAGLIEKDKLVADFKNDYQKKFGTEIEVIEQPRKIAETELETELDNEGQAHTAEMIANIHRQEIEGALLVRMYNEGGIDEPTVLKYLDLQDEDHDTFLRIVDMFSDKDEEDEGDE